MSPDTSLQKKDAAARALLQNYELRFRRIEEKLALGMFQISTGENPRILSVNLTMARLLGYDEPRELAGKRAEEFLVQPADYDRLAGALLEEGIIPGMELHLKRKDGSATWVSLQGWYLDQPGSPDRVIECFAQDVTEHRVFEQESQYHESELNRFAVALAQSNKKLNLLSSITRHDILNKLTGLLGYMELVKSDCPAPEVQEYIRQQEEIIQSITLHIHFARDYEKIGIESPRWFQVREIIAAATAALPLQAISVEIATGDISIYADPMLEKVFYNLIENALRHGEHVTRIQFSAEIDETGARIICEDNGCGVPDRFKEAIFIRKHFKNTGFGLFLTRDILSITGFSIRENGVPGKGARFEITVPQGYFRTGVASGDLPA